MCQDIDECKMNQHKELNLNKKKTTFFTKNYHIKPLLIEIRDLN